MRHGIEHVAVTERPELERIIGMILEEFEDVLSLAQQEWRSKGRITKIVLYGSRARGDWVDLHHTHVGKHSDWDLIVMVNDERLTDRIKYWRNVTERLYREYRFTHRLRSPAHYFVYTIEQINASLESGRYFFIDFLRDGIVVYETDDAALVEPKPMSPKRVLKLTQEYFEDWFKSSIEFYDDYIGNVEKDRIKKAAYELHQCVERLYHSVLLVYTLYTPHSHNIVELRNAAELHDPALASAWPREEDADVAAFEKLQQAYVKARYPRDYHISEEQLAWLGEHAEHLIKLVEASCKARIARLEDDARK
ncbi:MULTISPECIES: HEPN domain-containing protein [Sphingomonadaceae]|uniref:HEPN domain-containing protein n=1 Tax=Sphingomonadales TaxID=204457 RepID=UPI0007706965|nr:HEPN domain-containing protein [Sphingobium sp. TKS]AMK23196.1 putative nucleotidyltransferase [Sphingobium sp. TKS]MCF8707568.1 HEPN domain-containing protein [Rhizorhapis sp. SPR117]